MNKPCEHLEGSISWNGDPDFTLTKDGDVEVHGGVCVCGLKIYQVFRAVATYDESGEFLYSH